MIAPSLRCNRVILAGLIAFSFVLAPARDCFADWQNPVGVCKDSRGCGSGSGSGGGAISSSGGGSIPWGHMTSRGLERIKGCGDPLCWMIQGPIAIAIGAICDGPYYAVKGAGYGLYYGGRGLGQGLAYTGRAIGRGLAYPFNRPPKPDLPPTTWEQYKHDVLRHQKRLAKADKANKENQRWCVKHVPLEISPNRARWEDQCNPDDAVSRASLPHDITAASASPVPAESVAAATIPAAESPIVVAPTAASIPPDPTVPSDVAAVIAPAVAQAASVAAPAAAASSSGTPPEVAAAVPVIPLFQDAEKALAGSEPQVKAAGAAGFDASGPMLVQQAPARSAPDEVAADIESTPKPAPKTSLSTAVEAPPEVKSSMSPAVVVPTPAPAPSAPSATPDPTPKTAPGTASARAPVPAMKFILPKGIIIDGDKEYQRKLLRDLDLISKTKSGEALLKSIKDSGMKMTIQMTVSGKGNEAGIDSPIVAGKDIPGYLKADGTAGPRAEVRVWFNPDRKHLLTSPGMAYEDAKWVKRPTDVGLFHELIHADDFANGEFDETPTTNKRPSSSTKWYAPTVAAGELRAVGLLGKHAYTENSYRKERGEPDRDFY